MKTAIVKASYGFIINDVSLVVVLRNKNNSFRYYIFIDGGMSLGPCATTITFNDWTAKSAMDLISLNASLLGFS